MDKKDVFFGSTTKRLFNSFLDELKPEKDNSTNEAKINEKNIELFSGKLSKVNGIQVPEDNKELENSEKFVLSEDETKRLKSINDE